MTGTFSLGLAGLVQKSRPPLSYNTTRTPLTDVAAKAFDDCNIFLQVHALPGRKLFPIQRKEVQ